MHLLREYAGDLKVSCVDELSIRAVNHMKKTLIILLIAMVSTLACARGTRGGRGGNHGDENGVETPSWHASEDEEEEQPPPRRPPNGNGYDATRTNNSTETFGTDNDVIARRIFFACVAGAIALWIVMLVMR
jgi:hypothetical protein